MGRLSTVAIVALSLAPGLASAATVSSFSVNALAQMTLAGATFVEAGGDALGSLDIAFALDQLDDFPQQSGNATVDTSFTRDDATGLAAAGATGTAAGPFGSASADVHGRLVQTITNTSAAAITLAFDYTLGFDGSTSGPDAEVLGSAFVELQDFFGQVFLDEIPLFSTPPQSFSGQTTLGNRRRRDGVRVGLRRGVRQRLRLRRGPGSAAGDPAAHDRRPRRAGGVAPAQEHLTDSDKRTPALGGRGAMVADPVALEKYRLDLDYLRETLATGLLQAIHPPSTVRSGPQRGKPCQPPSTSPAAACCRPPPP